MPANVFGAAQRETDGRLDDTTGPYTMTNKRNKIPDTWSRLTALFVGAYKQKRAISEPGLRACTVKLFRCSVMPLILSAWVKSEERG